MDDDGYTLIELLVVVGLLAVVGAIVSNVMIGGLQQQTQVTARLTTVENLRVQMQRITRDIRNSTWREGPTNSSLTVCLDVTGGSRQLTYGPQALTGGNALVEVEYDYTSSCATNPPTGGLPPVTKVLLTAVPTSPAVPLFSYNSWSGFTTTDPTVDPSTCLKAGTSPPAYVGTCLGTVTVTLSSQPSSGPVLSLTDVVDLRNQS